MYSFLLFLHSLIRWLVLTSLLYSTFRAYKGYRFNLPFTQKDNAIRHWTATISHLQLMIGMVLYTQSPLIKYFFSVSSRVESRDPLFFAIIHLAMMMAAIILLTVGSAWAKRKGSDQEKFRTMFYWFAAALLLILLAIPWPFSPFAHRPYLRLISL